MINRIPITFNYSKSIENLFLFYQRASELLFDFSPDSYKVSSHNTHSLCVEAYNILIYLKKDNSLPRFYKQYIPDILSELIYSLKKDTVAKELLGHRYSKYIELLEQSKNAASKDQDIMDIMFFEGNIKNLLSYFSAKRYYDAICKRLKLLICGEKGQQDIINLTNTFICELIYSGYSKQHIYNVIMHYFREPIDSAEKAISDLLKLFSFEPQEWEIITFANSKLYKYYRNELHEIISSDNIEITDVSEAFLDELIQKDASFQWLKKTLINLSSAHFTVSLIKAKVKDLDPYSAYDQLDSFLNAINAIVTVFDNEIKIGYSSIACLNYEYKKTIKIVRAMEKRPRLINREGYAARTAAVLKEMHISRKMLNTFLKTAGSHGDALSGIIDDKYTLIMLWTALETLFVDNSNKTNKSTVVIDSLIAIIQRTYIIKTLKYFQYDLLCHLRISHPDIIKKYSLEDIKSFIDILFATNNSTAVTEICDAIEKNPLLRSRIFHITDDCLKTNEHILNLLKTHQQRIEWQIKRIYRTRNLIVHTDQSVPYIKDLVENLHNYLDFTMNFIICKSWHGENVSDIKSLVAEVKIDNEIHTKMLCSAKKDKTEKHIYESLLRAFSEACKWA